MLCNDCGQVDFWRRCGLLSNYFDLLFSHCCIKYVVGVWWQDAGNAVKRATEALVNEAQKVHSWSSSYHEESSVMVDERMVGGMAQVSLQPSL